MIAIGAGTGSSVCGDVFIEVDNLPAGDYLTWKTAPGPATQAARM
ncbi:MAG: hypothetical protein ABSH45_10550 [Bryobacteraceae bacterium]|jgi:hypothetical protein